METQFFWGTLRTGKFLLITYRWLAQAMFVLRKLRREVTQHGLTWYLPVKNGTKLAVCGVESHLHEWIKGPLEVERLLLANVF